MSPQVPQAQCPRPINADTKDKRERDRAQKHQKQAQRVAEPPRDPTPATRLWLLGGGRRLAGARRRKGQRTRAWPGDRPGRWPARFCGLWTRLFSDDQEGLPVTIALAAGEIDPEWPKEPLTKEKGEELLQSMFAGAARAYRYFEADRKSFAESGGYDASFEEGYPETYVRPERKVGRNEPCPCGSGKKFKKCCGSATIGPLH